MILGVIPARMASTRFPGKPLADLCGKPMIFHVYQRCLEAGCLDRVVVATDDAPIEKTCAEIGVEFVHARNDTGECLDCVAEAAKIIPADRYLCIQGDEPLIAPEAIRLLAKADRLPACGYAESTDPMDAADATVPKVVVSSIGRLVYLSRAPVPYPTRRVMPLHFQVCVYALDRQALQAFAGATPGQVERQEGLGLLRFLEVGLPVWMVKVPPSPIHVDTPADLERARALMGKEAH